MDSEKILDTIDKQQWLEEPAAAVQKAALAPFEAAGTSGTKVKDFLHGRWLGHSLHPALDRCADWCVDHVAAVFDALSARSGSCELDNAADTAIGIGLIGAAGAAITGIADWAPVEERPAKVAVLSMRLLIWLLLDFIWPRGSNVVREMPISVAPRAIWLGRAMH